MSTSTTIVHNQIKAQIEGSTTLEINFNDSSRSDYVTLYAQVDNQYWIQPAFCKPAKISKEEYEEILDMPEFKETFFNTDVLSLSCGMSYNGFYEKYFNNRI